MIADDLVYVENPDDADDWVLVENPDWEPVECFDVREIAHRNANRSTKYTRPAELTALVGQVIGKFGVRRKIPVTRSEHVRIPRAVAATWFNRKTNKINVTVNQHAWPLLTPEERFDTILHEAAHVVQFASCQTSNHGHEWKRVAKFIGCSGERCINLGESRRRQIAEAYQRRREGR